MQGDYRGDFTRDTFNPKKHFLRVLQQQARVILDADFNEQASILLHYLQALAVNLIGPHGGFGDSFKIDELKKNGEAVPWDFLVQPGHYYVNGILVENDVEALAYTKQLPQGGSLANNKSYLVYLDVWERHITSNEDDSIREVALGGPDTATRAKVVWQVRVTNETSDKAAEIPPNAPAGTTWREWMDVQWPKWIEIWQPATRGMLKARVKPQEVSTSPCITSPESQYRGAENQLYRVEIHDGGTVDDSTPSTFKWSRDNGSVVFPIRKLADKVITLEHQGRDDRLGLQPDDWVEILDDDYVLRSKAGPLVQVDRVDISEMTVTLRSNPTGFTYNQTKHPELRRWDHEAAEPGSGQLQQQGGPVLIKEGTGESDWIELEKGIQIQFQPSTSPNNQYRAGDYWLIPARTATGDIEWPGSKDNPLPQLPHGVIHSYAPLAILGIGADGKPEVKSDLRLVIEPLGKPVP